MRIANVGGRLTLVVADGVGIDVNTASQQQFDADPQLVFDRWDEFAKWAGSVTSAHERSPIASDALMPPVPRPRQVFALALNYADHSAEAKRPVPTTPVVFTKFPTCLAGPGDDIHLPEGNVDWEIELVVVIGKTADRVSPEDAWSHVAGLCAGQDISERILQLGGLMPQLALAKSMPGFGPLGPVMVTIDELANPDDLALGCRLNGEVVQESRTSHMVFSVPEIVSRVSATCVMLPGDLIFTGTPSGVGASRTPPRYLADGDVLESYIEGIGELRNTMRSAARPRLTTI